MNYLQNTLKNVITSNFKKLPSFVCMIAILFFMSIGNANGQTTYTIGSSGANYTSISGAISGIGNISGISGGIILSLQSNYSQTSETIGAVTGASASHPVVIEPASGVSSLSLTASSGTTWTLSGCSYVTIDGRAGGTGSIVLTLSNSSASGVSLQFLNAATNNKVQYVNISGENTSTTAGTVMIGNSTATSGNGNSNNTIDHCNITAVNSSSATSNYGIYISGYNATNDNLTITNNNIADYWSASGTPYGIYVGSYVSNTAGSIINISGNSFYQTTTRTLFAGASTGAINVTNASGYGFQIYNNYIGGTSAQCGTLNGSYYSITSTTSLAASYYFKGIQITANSSTTLANQSFVFGNTFQNIYYVNYNNASNSNATTNSLIAILGGTVQCGVKTDGTTAGGNILGNTSSSTTGANASIIYLSGNSAAAYLSAIFFSNSTTGATTSYISNNTIAGISVGSTLTIKGGVGPQPASNANNSIIAYFAGVNIAAFSTSSAVLTVSNNSIGNGGSGVTDSLMSIVNFTGRSSYGILLGPNTSPSSGTTVNVTGNAINNIANHEAASGQNAGYIHGIYTQGTACTFNVTNNTISELWTNNSNVNTGTSPSSTGIGIYNGTGTSVVSGNTVFNIFSAKYYLDGIFAGSYNASGTTTISGNQVYNIYSTGTQPVFNGASITGIRVMEGPSASCSPIVTVQNNLIRLGYDRTGAAVTTACPYIGIRDSTNATTGSAPTHKYYFNTVYLGGTGVANSTTTPTFAFYTSGLVSGTSLTRTIENNLFINARSSSSGSSNIHYAFGTSTTTGLLVGTAGVLTINYNDYVASGTGGTLATIGTTSCSSVANIQTADSKDANSVNIVPSFSAATTTPPNLSLTSSNSTLEAGISISGITSDYYGNTRESTPYIGGYEYLPTTTWNGSVSNVWTNASNWSNGVPSSTISTTIPASLSTYPSLTTTAAVGQLTIASGATITNTGSLQINGNASVVGTITGAGTVVFEASASLSGAGSISNLQTTSGATVTLGSNFTATNLNVVSGSTLADAGFTLTTSTSLTIAGTHTSTGSGEIKMTGASTTISGGGTIGGLEIAPGSSNTITVSTAPAMIGNLLLTSGTLADGGFEVRVAGNVTGTGTESGTGRINLTYVTSQAISSNTSGSTAVTLSGSNSSIVSGQLVYGSGIASGTTVSTISGVNLTLSTGTSSAATGTLYFSNSSQSIGSVSGTMTISSLAKSSVGTATALGNVIITGDFVVLATAQTGSSNATPYNDGGYITAIGGNLFNFVNNRINELSSGSGKLSMTGIATNSGLITSGTVAANTTTATAATTSIVTFTGGAYGIAAKGYVSTINGSNQVTAITITDPGTGYTSAPTGYTLSGTGSGTGTFSTAPVIATSTATKYLSAGINAFLVQNLELSNTTSNNTYIISNYIQIQNAFSFATAAQPTIGTSGANTTGSVTFSTTNAGFYIGSYSWNTNYASPASVTMANTNSFICGTSGAPMGYFSENSTTAIGTIYFSSTNNYLTTLTQWPGSGSYLSTSAATMTLGTSIVVSNLNINSPANLIVGSGANLTVPSTIAIGSTGAIDATNSNATVTIVNGNTIASGTFVSSSVGNLTVTNAAPTLNQAITVNGNLTLNSTNASTYSFTNGSNLTMASGSSIIYNNTSTGSLTLASVPTFSGTVKVSYTGSSALTTGKELPTASGVVSNLTISGGAKITMNAPLTTASNSTLALTSGKLVIGSNNLVLGSGSSITGASSSNYILSSGGTVTINGIAANGGSFAFPIGFTNSGTDYYTPITISNQDATNSANLTANAVYRTTAVNTAANVINVQWSALASPSISTNITFGYTSANFATSFTAGTGDLGQFNGSSYTMYPSNPITIGATSTSVTGLTLPASGINQFILGNAGAVQSITSTTWTGGTSTDWATASNWNYGVPTSALDAIIPSGTTYAPTVAASTTVQVNSLTITSATVTLGSNAVLNVNGASITNNGTIAGTTGVLNLGSTSGSQSVSGTGNIYNLTVNNSYGVSIASGSQTVTGALALTSGTLTLTGGLTVNGSVSSAGGKIAGSSQLSYGSGIPVTYTAAATTGSELTPNSGSIGLLTINAASATVTLGSAATVNGIALTAGTLADGGFTLTNSGALSGTGTHTGTGEIKLINGASITGAVTLATLEIAPGGGNTVNVTTAPSIIKNLILTSGTLADGGKEIKVTGNVTGTGTESGTGRITMAYVTSQTVGTTQGSASATVTLSAANSSIVVGQTVFGGSVVYGGTTVSAISGTTLTLSGAGSAALTAGTVLYFSNTHTLGSNSGTMTIGNFATSSTGTTTAAGNVIISGDFVVLPQATTGNNSVQIFNDGGHIIGVGGNTFNFGSQRANLLSNATGSSATGKISLIGTATSSGLISKGTVAAGSTTGFAVGDTVYLTSGATYGVPAKAVVATLSGSAVATITLFDPGSGYTVAPTGYVKQSGAGSGTGSLTSASIATTSATKYINIGNYFLYNNIELANTAANNTVSANISFNVQGTFGFATASQAILGTSGGNTSGTFTLAGSTLYIGGNVNNTNLATAAAITMANTNAFIGGTTGAASGGIFAVSTSAIGPIYFSSSANVISLLEQNTNNTASMTIANAVVPTSIILNATSNLIVGSGGNLTYPSSVTLASTGKIDATTSGATITLANAINIASGTFLNNAISNLTITNAAPSLGQAITVNGTLTLNATSATSYNATTNGNLTMATGSSIIVNQISTGTQNLSATPTFAGTANYTYTGSNAITMGNEMATATSVVNNLTINNAAGVTLNTSNDLTVNGALTLTSGKLSLGNSNLFLTTGTASLSGASTSNYVVVNGTGVVTWTGLSSSSKVFPIGTSSYYTPLTIANTVGTSDVSASIGTSLFTVADATKVVGLKWSVIGTAATTATVTYQFNAANKRSSFNVAGTCDLGVYDGTNYTTLNAGTPTGSDPYSVTVSGLSIPNSTDLNANQYVVGNTGDVVPVVITRLTWTGATSTSWTDPTNWDSPQQDLTPDSTYDVTIPASLSRYPSVGVYQTAKSLTLGSGATLALTSGGIVNVDGSVVNGGTISGVGQIILSGASTQNISGNGSISNLNVENASAVISGANQTITNVTLNGGSIAATGTLTIPTGGTVSAIVGNITGNGLVYGTGAGVIVTYSGAASYTSAKEIAPASGVASLVLNGTGSYTLGSSATVKNLTISTGSLADAGFTLTVTGNLSNAGSHTGSGKISMTSAANDATIAGSGTLSNLEIAAGSNSVTVTSAPASIKNLTMTSGTLANGTNELVVSGNLTGSATISGTGRVKIAPVTTATVGAAQGSTSTTVTLSAANSNIVVGQYVTGYGAGINVIVPITVSAISGTTLTLSSATTVALPVGSVLYFSNTAHTIGGSSGTLTLPNLAIGSSGAVTMAGNVTVNGDFATLYSANNNGTSAYYSQIIPNSYTLSVAGNFLNFENAGRLNFSSTVTGKVSMTGTATGSGLVSYSSVSSVGSGLTAYVSTVTFTGGVLPAKGLITGVTGGAVSAITITDPGVGYSTAPTTYTIDGTGYAGNVTGAVIGNTTAAKYMTGSIFFNNLELANTVANNTVSTSTILIGASLSFTSGNSTGGLAPGFIQIGAVVSNPNNPSSATLTMASTNSFIGGNSSSNGVGSLWFNSTSANIGTAYISSTNNYFYGMRIDNAATAITIANSINITNLLTLNGGTITLGSGVNYSIYPTTITESSGYINASNANATVTLNAATTLPASMFNPATIGNLVINNAAPTLNQAVTVSNSLTLNSTTATNYTIANGSNLTIGTGASITKNKTGTGKMALNTIPTFTSLASNSFSYLGSKLDTIGNEMPSSTNTITALTINNSGNVTMKGYDITTSGALTLTAGDLITGNNNIIAGSVTGGNASSYVLINGVGTLKTSATGGSARLYPVGIRPGYTPVIITPSTTQAYTVGLSNNAYSIIPGDTTQVLKVQWSVLGSTAATTATVKYGFSTAEFSTGYTVSASELGANTGSGWSIVPSATSITPTNDSTTYYSLTATSVSIPYSGSNYYVIGDKGNVVVTSTQWTGAFSSDWGNYLNWTNNVPSVSDSAVIGLVSYPNYGQPIITAPQSVKNISIATGVTITNNDTLNVVSKLINNGIISGTGTTILNGTAVQTVSGTGIVGNLTLNNSNGASITGSLGVSGVLTLQSGKLTTNNNLTLKSLSITNSGVLAPYGSNGNTGTISGNVTVERYIPQGFRAYRDLSASGVYSSSNTLFNTWQEGGLNNKGYGMFITGILDTTVKHNSVDASTGLDHSLTGYSSAYYYRAGWDTVKNTTSTLLNPYQSYRVLVRGDRNFDLDTTGVVMVTGPSVLGMNDATTLRASGTLITGNVTFTQSGVTNGVYSNAIGLNSSNSGYTYIANPYPCPIDFHNIYTSGRLTNMDPRYYYLDPTIGSTGSYVSYNALSNASSYANAQFIQAGQGFLVQNAGASPQLVITEADKSILTTSKTAVFGATTNSKLALSLLKHSGSTYIRMDAAVAVFGNNFSNGLGLEDNTKMSNASDNLAIAEGGHSYSIDGRLPATTSDVLGISLGQLSGTDYKFVIDASAYMSNGLSPYLVDAYTNKITALTVGIDTIAFTTDASVATSYQNRFSVIFKPTTLAVNSIVASASLKNNTATIVWNTVGEKGVATYTVEKSTDGTSFTSIGQQAAKNTVSASYTATDNDVVATTYYRIKAVSTDGTIAYSNTVKLTTDNSPLTTYNLFPNPLTGKTLNVQLGNVVAGKYAVSIYNSLGQKVIEQAINHAGGNGTHAVNVDATIAKGVYNVVIRKINSKEQVFQSTLSIN